MLRNTRIQNRQLISRTTLTTAAACVTAVVIFAAAGWSHPVSNDSLRVAAGSKVWVSGGSTVRDWKCDAVDLEGIVSQLPGSAYTSLAEIRNVVSAVKVNMAVAKMECGNNTMNDHMRKALKAESAPGITFTVSGYEVAMDGANAAALKLRGTLSIAGAEKAAVVDARVAVAENGALVVTGEHKFNMSEFGVKPPSLMLGTMKVKDEVVVGFEMILR